MEKIDANILDKANGNKSDVSLTEMLEDKEISNSLGVPADVHQQAWQTFRELNSKFPKVFKEDVKPWFCCLLYIISLEFKHPNGNEVNNETSNQTQSRNFATVSQILNQAQINMFTFFQKLKKLNEYYSYNPTVKSCWINLERKYCIISAIYYKFENVLSRSFLEEDVCQNHSHYVTNYLARKELIWTMFSVARGTLLPINQDLVTTFDILLCCLNHVIHITPSIYLQSPYDDLVRDSSCGEKDRHLVLCQLCSEYQAGFVEVLRFKEKYWDDFISSLPSFSDPKIIQVLIAKYQELHKAEGDFDELLFLSNDPQITVRPRSQEDTKSDPTPLTPVKRSLVTLRHLRDSLKTAQDTPSPVLLSYFKNCCNDPSETIINRLKEMKQKFCEAFMKTSACLTEDLSDERFKLAARMYYRTMTMMLKIEEERIGSQDLGRVLHVETFHKSLLACAVEVVFAAYDAGVPPISSPGGSASPVEFPWILEVFQLEPYDFFKIIETFVKTECKLPKEIIKHLKSIENQVLDSLAWKKNSRIFTILEGYRIDSINSTPPRMGTTPQEVPNANGTNLYLSPMVNRTKSNISSSPSTPTKGPQGQKSQSLNLFLNKVCRLGYQRLDELSKLLDISQDLTHKSWLSLEHSIYQYPELMKDRNLDQLIMCAIYAICKASDEEKSFKNIVNIYRTLPHASSQVYKSVWCDGSFDSIITFYNGFYIRSMKAFLIKISQSKQVGSALKSALLSPVRSPANTVRYGNNCYASPLKQSPFKVPLTPSRMTPRTRQLYCTNFGDGLGGLGHSDVLKSINEKMNAIKRKNEGHGSVPKGQKRLRFDSNEPEASTSTNSASTSPQISRRILNFVNERKSEPLYQIPEENPT